ncbi:hypothetical protein JMJ77_0008154, partial [Colletotrichum scovillei]
RLSDRTRSPAQGYCRNLRTLEYRVHADGRSAPWPSRPSQKHRHCCHHSSMVLGYISHSAGRQYGGFPVVISIAASLTWR